jgi:hypothetical protein
MGTQSIKDAAAQSAQTQQQMFEQGQAATAPYRQAGEDALTQMQGLMTPEGAGRFAQQYTQSPIYKALQEQAEQATLRGASATGGLRTGGANVALSSIAPQLINQAYGHRMQGLQGLTAQGASAAGQTAGIAPNVGTNIGSTQYQGGVAAAGPQFEADTAMSGFLGDAISTIGGVGADAYSNFMNAPTQVATRPGQTYGR